VEAIALGDPLAQVPRHVAFQFARRRQPPFREILPDAPGRPLEKVVRPTAHDVQVQAHGGRFRHRQRVAAGEEAQEGDDLIFAAGPQRALGRLAFPGDVGDQRVQLGAVGQGETAVPGPAFRQRPDAKPLRSGRPGRPAEGGGTAGHGRHEGG
jgi:hypothetical protein